MRIVEIQHHAITSRQLEIASQVALCVRECELKLCQKTFIHSSPQGRLSIDCYIVRNLKSAARAMKMLLGCSGAITTSPLDNQLNTQTHA